MRKTPNCVNMTQNCREKDGILPKREERNGVKRGILVKNVSWNFCKENMKFCSRRHLVLGKAKIV